MDAGSHNLKIIKAESQAEWSLKIFSVLTIKPSKCGYAPLSNLEITMNGNQWLKNIYQKNAAMPPFNKKHLHQNQ